MKFNMKTLFLMTNLLGNLLNAKATPPNVTYEATTNTGDFGRDSVCSDTQYFSFCSSNPEVDNNTYTLALTTPASCSTIYSTVSALGAEFVEIIANITQQIQMGKCDGVNVSVVQSYKNKVLQEIPIGKYQRGPDGPSEQLACYSLEITSIEPFKETPFSQCLKDSYVPVTNKFKESYEKCDYLRISGLTATIIMAFLLIYGTRKVYKHRDRIAASLNHLASGVRSTYSPSLWIRVNQQPSSPQQPSRQVAIDLDSPPVRLRLTSPTSPPSPTRT